MLQLRRIATGPGHYGSGENAMDAAWLELSARPEVANRSRALKADVCAAIVLHAVLQNGEHPVSRSDFVFRKHVAKRINGFDAHAGILVVH